MTTLAPIAGTSFALDVSADGKKIEFTIFEDTKATLKFTLPSPVSAQLIASLQTADGVARDRYNGTPDEKGGLRRISIREPKSFHAWRDPALEKFVMCFDQGLPTEMAFGMPLGSEFKVAQAMLPLLQQPPAPATKPN